jgi:hypothetical protein
MSNYRAYARMWQGNRKSLIHLGIFALATVIAIAPLMFLRFRQADAELPSLLSSPAIPVADVQTVDDMSLILNGIAISAGQTEFEFEFLLPDRIVDSLGPNSDTLGPMFAQEDILFAGIEPLPSGIVLVVRHQDNDVTFVLTTGPINDQDSDQVSVTIQRLVIDTEPEATILEGPWVFILSREAIAANAATFSREVNQSTLRDGISVTIDRVEERPSGLDVYFTIGSQTNHKLVPADSQVHLAYADGSESSRVQMVPLGVETQNVAAGTATQFVATFPSVSRDTIPLGAVNLVVGSFLSDVSDSVEITIDNPLGGPSATMIEYGGETFAVEASVLPDTLGVAVAITNVEPISNATRMFIGVDAEIVAIDDQGHSYRPESVGTGLRRDDNGNMGAGDSILIVRFLDPQATSLNLIVSESNDLVRGPWEVEFALQ